MTDFLLRYIKKAKFENKKLVAILLDPDKLPIDRIAEKINKINKQNVDILLIGGSLLFTNHLDNFVKEIKKHTIIPVILFPGNAMQISDQADGILFLSLLSGRNPEFLIGNHIIAAPILNQTDLEVLSTSYILIESGRETTVSYISNTKPIPQDKPEIAMATALAGKMMGHSLVYLDGGSGAMEPIPADLISLVVQNVDNPVIVGGGIRSKEQMQNAFNAGATLVVIGTAFENNDEILNIL